MRADDDGFVNNPKSIMRQAGSTVDDMNLLIAKRFILNFNSFAVTTKVGNVVYTVDAYGYVVIK